MHMPDFRNLDFYLRQKRVSLGLSLYLSASGFILKQFAILPPVLRSR
jgi:hypothetical protein